MVVEDENGKQAISRFTTLERFAEASEMSVQIETGRTHQIRVHCSGAGHPIIGDTKYGDKQTNRGFRQQGLTRMYLHALELSISDEIQIYCEAGSDWAHARATLRGIKTE